MVKHCKPSLLVLAQYSMLELHVVSSECRLRVDCLLQCMMALFKYLLLFFVLFRCSQGAYNEHM